MSVPAKLASSFGAQAAVAILGIGIVPVYLSLMGPEGYGLIGFHVTLQTWMLLLDMGVPTALGRRLSVWKSSKNAAEVAPFIKAVERTFWWTAFLVAVLFVAASSWIGNHWLGRSELGNVHVVGALRLMGCMVGARWIAALYQAALVGLECQHLVNTVIVVGALGRTAGAVVGLIATGGVPEAYFVAQLAGTLIEVMVLRSALTRRIPLRSVVPSSLRSLLQDFNLAGSFALITVFWLAVNQIDKVILSHVLSLRLFGLFSIVTAICTGIATLVPAFTQPLQPRLTALMAEHKRGEFVQLYRLSVALLFAFTASLAGTIAAHPMATFYAWTGDAEAGRSVARVLALYAAGTGLANMLLAPFLLQYALGDVRVQVRSYVMVGTVWIPAVVWSTYAFGAPGAGLAWFIGNVILLSVCWCLAHRRLLTTEERAGMNRSVLVQVLSVAAGIALLAPLPVPGGRVSALVDLTAAGGTAFLLGIVGSKELRGYLLQLARTSSMARMNLRRDAHARHGHGHRS